VNDFFATPQHFFEKQMRSAVKTFFARAIKIASDNVQKGEAFTRPVGFITTNYHARSDSVSSGRQWQSSQ